MIQAFSISNRRRLGSIAICVWAIVMMRIPLGLIDANSELIATSVALFDLGFLIVFGAVLYVFTLDAIFPNRKFIVSESGLEVRGLSGFRTKYAWESISGWKLSRSFKGPLTYIEIVLKPGEASLRKHVYLVDGLTPNFSMLTTALQAYGIQKLRRKR